MSNVTTVLFPSLDSMMMMDWLPKLGEKAFMAWLRLHSWKDPSAASPSVVLPLSINRIIKRLKVGNSTFYDQILRPLWNYGLIDLKKADAHKKEQHLVLHTFPYNDPNKSSAPLLQIRDYDLDPAKEDSFQSAENLDPQEDLLHQLDQEETPEAPASSSSPASVIQEDRSPYLIPSKHDMDKKPVDPSSLSLPHSLQKTIEENPEWQKRSQSIQRVYERCKDHPYYNDEEFLQKIHTCIRYPHDPQRFAPYLQKSLFNEWSKRKAPKLSQDTQITRPNPSPPLTPTIYPGKRKGASTYRTQDVPEWIQKQQENTPSDTSYDLNQEQQAIIDQLLKDLGEV